MRCASLFKRLERKTLKQIFKLQIHRIILTTTLFFSVCLLLSAFGTSRWLGHRKTFRHCRGASPEHFSHVRCCWGQKTRSKGNERLEWLFWYVFLGFVGFFSVLFFCFFGFLGSAVLLFGWFSVFWALFKGLQRGLCVIFWGFLRQFQGFEWPEMENGTYE